MSDIVEIALDRFTDYTLFERLACEILREEGYPAIKPLGGVGDGGLDAEEQPLFVSDGGRQRTIFQMSMEENALGKVRKTINRLAEQQELYGTLVYVTTRTVETSKQNEIKRIIRKEYDVTVDIISRETMVVRLADYSNGIFRRFFPNIESQLEHFRNTCTSKKSHAHEIALLRTTLALNFGDRALATQKLTFDHLVLSIITGAYPTGLTHDEILERMGTLSKICDSSGDDITKSIERLSEKGSITFVVGKAVACKGTIDATYAGEIRSECALESIVTDVIDLFMEEWNGKVQATQIDRLRRNCREVLIDFFRLFGSEMGNLLSNDEDPKLYFSDAIPEIVEKSKRQVGHQLGDMLIACIAQILEKPTPDQSKYISVLALSYVGAAVLGLDPVLREVTADTFSKKTFYLDTDIVITCLVQETPFSDPYIAVITRLLEAGAKLVIPFSSVRECAAHALYSYKTYDFFGDQLLSLPESTVQEQVWNGFVKGYYFGRRTGSIPAKMSYRQYIKNYLDKRDPFRFMSEAIENRFTGRAIIQDIDKLLMEDDIPENVRFGLEREIYEQLRDHAKKAEYRTDDQNWELARTDARLFLTVYYLNSRQENDKERILAGNHYLITSSGRYMYCAKKIDLKGKVTTRLQAISGLLKTLGKIDLSPSEFMQLLENPFLQFAVSRSREDILGLLDSGFNLAGVSLPRLRRDLDEGLHDKLTAAKRAIDKPIIEGDLSTLGSDEFLDLVEEAENRDYTLTPDTRDVVTKLKMAKNDYDKKLKIIDQYADIVKSFGNRKKKFLKRIEKQAQIKKTE